MPKHKGRDRSLPDPEDVLGGRVKPSLAELLELIHRANPTGRDLRAREAELRYAQKARLQSLLVRRFQAELEVVPDEEGVVSLRHRGHARDGCHAVIASLDEDARAWVQLQVDLGTHVKEAAPPPAPSKSGHGPPAPPAKGDGEDATPEALLQRGEEASLAYDYELAQDLFSRALRASGGAAAPATALLALLVETLGDDRAALDLVPALSRAALADAKVRGLLALAAARTGDEEHTLAWLRGVDEIHAATVWSALAAAALRGGDVERAAEHLVQARMRDPACPALPAVAEEIARARAVSRGPEEVALAELLAKGRTDEAEKKATQVLARWPDSEAARRALRGIEEQKRRSEAARHAAEAESALAAGDVGVALGHLGQALVTARGPEREVLERRMREIDAAQRTMRAAEQVEHVCGLLDGPGSKEGLVAYLGLDEALRAEVRARRPRAEWSALDLAAGARASDRAKVDAVLALGEARALAEREPEAALALLGPHETVLERVPDARRIARQAEAGLRAQKVERARAAVTAARADLAADRAAEALSRIQGADLRELPNEVRAEAAAIEAEATRIVERQRRAEELGRMRGAGRVFEALALGEVLARDEGGPRWEDELRSIRAEIRRAFRVDVDEEPHPAEELGRFRPDSSPSKARWWLTADGRRVVLAHALDRWVLVRVLNLQTMHVCPTVLLRTPEPLGSLDAVVCGPTLWLIGQRGAFVEIRMEGWEVRDFRPSRDAAPEDRVVEIARVVAAEDPSAPRYFWVASRSRDEDTPDRTRIIDLTQRRTVREMPAVWRVEPVACPGEPRVAVFKETSCTLHTPRGALVEHGRLELGLEIQDVVSHPTGHGWAAYLAKDPVQEFYDETVRPLHVGHISSSGDLVVVSSLEDTNVDLIASLASSQESGFVFAIARITEGYRLFAFEAGAQHLTQRWQADLGAQTLMVQDAGARRVVALTLHHGGADAALLGAEPPALPSRPAPPFIMVPNRYDMLSCQHAQGERTTAVMDLFSAHQREPASRLPAWIREREEAPDATPEQLVDVVLALRVEPDRVRYQAAKAMVLRLFDRFPGHPEVRLLRASEHALAGEWAEVRTCLAGVEASDFDPSRAQHVHHLRAFAAYEERHFEEMAREVAAARTFDGQCALMSLERMAEWENEGEQGSDNTSPFRQLVAAVREADAFFERGDHAGVMAALDRPVVWAARELQSLARLSEALLHADAESPVERVRKLVVLGTMLSEMRDSGLGDAREILFQGAWSAARIADVADRARAWLDALLEVREPSPRAS